MQQDPHTNQLLTIDVGDGHTLAVHDWGNKDAATPFIFLHGGPGSQIKEHHKAVFDPAKHRVIFFDQRGSGLSTPYGSLENNTTEYLISDISKIADELGIKKFALHGSSWGSALSLAYAIAHPERVAALVIGGIFTGSQAENDWLDGGLFKTFFPDVWQTYLERTPKEFRSNPTAYHFAKAVNGTPEEQKASCYAYECMEASIIKLDDRFTPQDYAEYDPAGIRVEMHYLSNGCFMPDRFILENAGKLAMPVHIIQGRYDMVCPPMTAYELHTLLPDSRIYWTLSGHAAEHEGQNIIRAIIAGM